MGLEQNKCRALIRNVEFIGKLHVDSKQLEFRNKEVLWTVKVGKGTSAKAVDGKLKVRRGSKSAEFDVGAKTEKWIEKVLYPPSRAKKLGLKPDMKFILLGNFDKAFEKELADHGLNRARGPKSCNIAFVLMNFANELMLFDKAAKPALKGVHIWAIWPKGIDAIRQRDVMGRAKSFGMGPGKGISFDDTYSAMRFTKK